MRLPGWRIHLEEMLGGNPSSITTLTIMERESLANYSQDTNSQMHLGMNLLLFEGHQEVVNY